MTTKRETPVKKQTKGKVTGATPGEGMAAIVPQSDTAAVGAAAKPAPSEPVVARPAVKKAGRAKAAVTKPATAKSVTMNVDDDPQERRQLIAMEAYYLAERRGFAAGHEDEDWIAAEAVVRSRQSLSG